MKSSPSPTKSCCIVAYLIPQDGSIKPLGFSNQKRLVPTSNGDLTGISVTRAKFKSIEQAAQGQQGKSYFVAVLCVGDLRNAKFTVKPQPNVPGGYDISHAELPDLNAGNYKATETLERQRELAEKLCLRVEGPFKVEEAAPQ